MSRTNQMFNGKQSQLKNKVGFPNLNNSPNFKNFIIYSLGYKQLREMHTAYTDYSINRGHMISSHKI